jgi:radical SAM protein with 4Fe4S-binding SPASM domain
MKENIEDIFRYIKKTGLKCFITSNGVLMTSENIRTVVETEVDRINISIDGVGERHDKIRGVTGTFEKARANVQFLVEERAKSGKKQPVITLHSTLSRLNIDQIEPVKKLKDEWRVDHVTFQYMVETPKEKVEETQFDGTRAASHRLSAWNDSLLFRREEVDHLRQTIRRMRERGEKLDFAMRSLEHWSNQNLLTGQVPIKRCYATHNHILINPFGDLIPCSNIDDLSFGSLRKNSLQEIWDSAKRREFMQELKQDFFPVCTSCANFSMTPGQIFTVVRGGTLQ